MIKQIIKIRRRFWSILILTITVFIFTVLSHYLSIDLVGSNFIDSAKTFKLTKELPLALSEEGDSQTPEINSTPSQEENSQPKTVIKEKTVFYLLLVVLIGVLILLWALLSPVIGFLGFGAKGNLRDKAYFLSESFPKLLEGVTVVLIVMVVTVLTLAGYINEQGTISILSALVGYVLGKKAYESEKKKQSDEQQLTIATPTSLSIKPDLQQVKFGSQLKINIDPPQDIEANVQPSVGIVKVQDQSTLIYTAPPKPQARNVTEVTITANSKDSSTLEATTKIQLID